MTEDRDLDAEIRATLRSMARHPAPDRLIARAASIPSRTPATDHVARSGISPLRRGFGLVGALAVVVLIVGALAIRGGILGGGPPPSGQTPIVGASQTPTGSGSSTPSPLPTPSNPSVATVPIPSDFQPLSATFVSADVGWVLGSTACGSSTCPAVARTADGGRTWTGAPAPATSIGRPGDVQAGAGVSGIRFADALDGWAFGPGLWATHDGGATWKQLSVPGGAGSAVLALEASAGSVHLAFGGANGQGYRVATSAIASDAWSVAPVTVPYGAGPVPNVQLVLSGSAGWLVENDRTVVAGARLSGGTWRSWQPACLDVVGPAVLAASSPSDVVALCDVGAWSTPQGEHAYRSRDGGQAFSKGAARLPVDAVSAAAAPNGSTVFAAGNTTSGAAVAASFDGGATWTTVAQLGQVSVTYLGFTTPTQGLLLTSGDGGRGQMLMTRDGGHSWAAVAF